MLGYLELSEVLAKKADPMVSHPIVIISGSSSWDLFSFVLYSILTVTTDITLPKNIFYISCH